MKISDTTFALLLDAMIEALGEQEQNSGPRCEGYDLTLAPAMYAALRGEREVVLREVAAALSPTTAKALDSIGGPFPDGD